MDVRRLSFFSGGRANGFRSHTDCRSGKRARVAFPSVVSDIYLKYCNRFWEDPLLNLVKLA